MSPRPDTISRTPATGNPELTFAVGTGRVYRTFVTAEPLVNARGEPATGRCDWASRLILINGNYPRETWKETWLHECRHAWDFHFKRPDDHEHAIDWDANVGDEAAEQLAAQGGLDALLSLEPVEGVAPIWMTPPPVLLPEPQVVTATRLFAAFCVGFRAALTAGMKGGA